ncbi:MAG: U32 family peptidase C-terminal domain-containing protein [Defluviitaleaceae bacterium]|nr:U32 family peptidase C-terminal domain-containing protein [Defluviitaleaceae bacterium]MCL2239478.1 U32 family peptidase C-terminal domain-containing protein [Defluviitaleaceae bacterium]
MNKPELLAPAGDLEKLRVAFAYGADAVYMGGRALGMRAAAKNFSLEEMAQGISHAHALGKKVYVTANIFAHNADFTGMSEYFTALAEMGADALIVSDLGVFSLARAVVPDMELHISTQANVTNYAAAAFWQGAGAGRVILARELSLREIQDINRKVPDLHIEAFVHGAMCMAYSGRCLISNYLKERDANAGACIQPCRWSYALVEEKSGELLPVVEDERGTYIFNARDLCMVRHIPDLVYAGVQSLKIEGRMKTAYYVAATVKAYREAIDDHHTDPELYESKLDHYTAALERLTHGHYSTGFYFGKVTGEDHSYASDSRTALQDFLAVVVGRDERTGLYLVEQRNKFSLGDEIEIFRPGQPDHVQTIDVLFDAQGAKITSAPHPKQRVYVKLTAEATRYDILRKKHITPPCAGYQP